MTARSAEQAQFATSLHGMLVDAEVPAAARRWAAGDRAPGLAVWRALAGLGVTALAVLMAIRQPSPGVPSTSASGTNTPSKKISANPASPPSWRIGRTVTPSARRLNIR